jgi:glucose/mannose transport system substrate-binding protein
MTPHLCLIGAVTFCATTSAHALEFEVSHWWTADTEVVAVRKIADAWTAAGHTWVDAALAGENAGALMVNRIVGGDPMEAFQFSPGREAEEMIEAGLLLDLTDLAEAENWREIITPPSLLDACTYDGKGAARHGWPNLAAGWSLSRHRSGSRRERRLAQRLPRQG